jgi:FkbM family methyltransferase
MHSYNTFSSRHPWLTQKLKNHYWNLLSFLGVSSFVYPLNDLGLKIKLNPNDNDVGKFVFNGTYEAETILFLSKFIKRGDIVMDIGANIGLFTLYLSSLVGNKGEVHSFEPSRREFLLLCENVQLNNLENVFLNQLALSNQSGIAEMIVLNEIHFGAYNSLGPISHRKVSKEKTHSEIVRTIKLDDYILFFQKSHPRLIKIDVEGFEKQVLEGMKTLLEKDNAPNLVVEVCKNTHKNKQNGTQDILAYLKKFNYRLFSPSTNGTLVPFVGETLNCIAIK